MTQKAQPSIWVKKITQDFLECFFLLSTTYLLTFSFFAINDSFNPFSEIIVTC